MAANERAPPSSAEEAAALLGAAISLDAPLLSPPTTTARANPPRGMHSIFAVQTPVPNQELFVRLCNLRAWLRWHAGALGDDAPGEDGEDGGEEDATLQLGISFPKRKTTKEPFNAARSILAVLMKLLEASSLVATGDAGNHAADDPASKVVKALSPGLKQRKHAKLPDKHAKQHTPQPPLLSTPLRNMWAECISLCLALGCSLPGNLRTDVWKVMSKMMEITGWNPRSRMAAGGVRLATLQALGQVCVTNTDLAKRTAPYAWDLLQCCHKGLLSGGAGDPGYREACVKTACRLLVACRRASAASVANVGKEDSFAAPGALEERVAVEAIKFVKRATSDKYPEVRMGAAVFAGLAAPMLVQTPRPRARKDGDGTSPLVWLEEVTSVAMRNIDDESAGVATAWAATLARCLCASAEHGQSVKDARSEDQASKRSADVGDDDDGPSDSANLDIAAKLKAFSEARRATAATVACSSVPATIAFLVSHFVKCGGETASNKCGGSHSIGGRATRIGWSDALTQFLCLQGAKGDFSLVDALDPVLEMVGAKFEKQILKKEGGAPHQMHDDLFYAPASPRSPTEKKAPSTSSMFSSTRNTKAKSTADSSIGRLLVSNVVRKGISENLSESSQLMMLRELTSACRSSVSSTTADGGIGGSTTATDSERSKWLNRHQLQVALVEMSHVIVALGEAGASSLEDLLPVLRDCLSHTDHGVRHEAAAVYAAIAQSFPTEMRVFVIESLGSFGANLDAIQSLSERVASTASSAPRNRFRRSKDEESGSPSPTDELIKHQSFLHGNALAVSLLCHEAPHLLGGVATAIVSKVFDVVGKLLRCQFNDAFVRANPSVACTCIRSGYCMLSGALSMGTDAIVPHVTAIFGFWQNSVMNLLPGVSKLSTAHDLLWLEAMLSSVVSFLKFCPNLLLAVPDALTRLTALLEKVFPLIDRGGRFERESADPVGSARLSSTRSSVLEAYSWLPPGSFPLSADRVFSFAAKQIQELSGDEVQSSLLDSLVSKEDELIEAHSVERAVAPGQIGGSVALDNNISIRSSDIVHHNEREAVLHLLAWRKKYRMRIHDDILSLCLREGEENAIPTPLHDVGTWRVPPDPLGAPKVRLLDSSIHVFAATFGLQDGHTQGDALLMLERMYLSTLDEKEKTSRFNVSTSLITDSQGKVKPQEEDVPASNLVTAVLACLQALPLHESTYSVLIDRGPPWMERATTLLLRLLPSASGIIRRGSAEGLSLLATLGAGEDAHTLQSTILHSLDEVMRRSATGANPKAQLETIAFAKAGALLTLACIQRAAKRMKRSEEERANARSVAATPKNPESDKTPTMIMMTRVLPALATQNHEGDSLLARTYALHSFGVLISGSLPAGKALSPEEVQIVWKAVEAVETSFLGAWSAVISENSKGREREKFASGPAFLAVLLRLMTTLVPWLGELKTVDPWISSRFLGYVATIVEYSKIHPAILFEGSVFFERSSAHRDLLAKDTCCIITADNAATVAMPLFLSVLQPPRSKVVADNEIHFNGCHSPIGAQRAAVLSLKSISSSTGSADESFNLGVGKALFAFLHDRCGRRTFQHFSEFRSLVVNFFGDCQLVETESISLIHSIFKAQLAGRNAEEKSSILLEWLLLARCLAAGDAGRGSSDADSSSSLSALIERARLTARVAAAPVLGYSNPPRWQLKCVSANLASVAMAGLLSIDEESTDSCTLFNMKSAQSQCVEKLRSEKAGVDIHSQPIFHLEELVLTACSTSTATSSHSELPSVQISGLRFLASLLRAFGSQLDASTNDGSLVLEQYSSQIVSSVKHALSAESMLNDSVPGTAFHSLFSSGCDALLVIISEELISDPIAMRRLLQPVLLSAEDTPLLQFPSDEGNENDALLMLTSHVTDDSRSFPLFRLSKLCFLAKTSTLIALGDIQEKTSSMITGELEKGETGRAIHCAAAAIDGFFLQSSRSNQSAVSSAGLTYKNVNDLDGAVVQTLVEKWPTLAASATASILKGMKHASDESEEAQTLHLWLKKLSPVIVSGLRDSLASLGAADSKASPTQPSVLESAALCVYALRLLVQDNECMGSENLCATELGDIAKLLTDAVVFSALALPSAEDGSGHLPPTILASQEGNLLTQQSCGFLDDLCQHSSDINVDRSILTRSVVTPLVAVQEKKIVLSTNGATVASCIRSSQSLLLSESEEGRAKFGKALVQLAMTVLKGSSATGKEVTAACLSLLKICCTETTLSRKEWGQIASFAAASGLWDAWAAVCSALPAGHGIKCSMSAIQASLGDLSSGPRHASALVALRAELQRATAEDPSLLSLVLQSVGFEVLQLLRAHGARIVSGQGFDEHRVSVCAESIKVNAMALQYLESKEEGKAVAFTSTLFEVLVESVSFNGLPNHPSGKAGADEAIGRMCAQVFSHVARTTPTLFKSTMGAISPQSRTVLEAAVRADMSGYAAPQREAKKKISLKGFVR
ncbi:hypothetical protein ACHAXT_002511 [Thalassiosira profunda]